MSLLMVLPDDVSLRCLHLFLPLPSHALMLAASEQLEVFSTMLSLVTELIAPDVFPMSLLMVLPDDVLLRRLHLFLPLPSHALMLAASEQLEVFSTMLSLVTELPTWL
ncbi:hypothetical protein M3202_18725 [Alkalihalobacillus oceani]|uniref:Uncharacterized protein n=1 Tax=Halalkalibacter oceani TaxID=1653776 RepID=A0A9X2DV37_9BACI|nr:hypothetical protein [Halalkalibacter oceani]